MLGGFMCDRIFKVSHVVQGFFHLVLQVRRQRPVRQTQTTAHVVQVAVEFERELIQIVTHISQPFRLLNHGIEIVAMNHPQLAAIRRFVNSLIQHLNATEVVV